MAAILGPGEPHVAANIATDGPGEPHVAANIATDGPGDLFWGDHRWHDRTEHPIARISTEPCAYKGLLINGIRLVGSLATAISLKRPENTVIAPAP